MVHSRRRSREEIVAEVLAEVTERVPREARALVEGFVAQYYAGTAAEDLEESTALNLYGAALAHFGFARHRPVGTPKVRAYNPQIEQHGWQSTHSIIEVVTDDMPFLVDSVRMAINRRGLTSHLVIHPVMRVVRDARGELVEVLERGRDREEASTEAVMHAEIDRQADRETLDELVADIESGLDDVRVAVQDWRPMRERLAEVLTELRESPPAVEDADLAEGTAFLEWMDDDHFTFLGFREYELAEEEGEEVLRAVPGSGLGILRESRTSRVSRAFASLPPEVRRLAREPELLVVTKSTARATVHRPGHMDYIGVKRFDGQGRVTGERRFLGLYTSSAYNRSPRGIPLLRQKVARVLERTGYPPRSHAAKALLNILETFPRDELFRLPVAELCETAMGILHLQERQRIRLFIHHDRYRRFYSCIVYVPRERFNTQVRETIQGILAEALGSDDVDFDVHLSESVLARLYFVLRVSPERPVTFDVAELEARLRKVIRVWADDLYDALLEHFGEDRGTRLHRRYAGAFGAEYREAYPPRVAVLDVERMETLAEDGPEIAMSLYRPLEAPPGELRLKLFRLGRIVALSAALPMLENMGLRVEHERPARIERAGAPRVWMHDFAMTFDGGADFDLDRVKETFQDAFGALWRGEVENDGFNRLVLEAGLSGREIVILRACCKYLRQVGMTFSQEYMERTLQGNPAVARLLVALFHARFDPARQPGEDRAQALAGEIDSALDAVANLDEDRILRRFLEVIEATLRTSFYQAGEGDRPKSYVSFKLDPSRIADLPEPRPMFEIWVYSPRVEGVHLRGGPVARGGLRWSDRREDFRTEVLGLLKAQMVKNAVIVPVGSKGGFVAKQPPVGEGREALQAEGVACYRIFIRGLLDLTDNLVAGEVVPPPGVVRHDGDDPYLVVAADKGTATFSDIANGIAAEYGFWLGDAFASGGSQGYDHKGMGITARGGWESVKRHFRELGTDVQSEDFTVVGIGDMAGDVFGNGMLLSPHIRLVGAFNHLHVFLDPDPDPAISHRERERLFALPRSSWDDYDRSLISPGGGVFPRSAKSIALGPEVRRALDIQAGSLTPAELIRALLMAPVDLLWNGGIGTYVKASTERHADVGDRANDAVRVDGSELRCRVVGEGGNLGCTQLGRIELARHGGRIYTDAIDNSGGVDCSDHEVNIKILLNGVAESGDITTKQRNRLLAGMTDEVAALVLRDNYLQTQALSLATAQAPSLLEVHSRLIRRLERDGALRREMEFLPGNEELEERHAHGEGLTAPELSVLFAYVKITLFQELLGSGIADDPFLFGELADYFPRPLGKRHGAAMGRHRLRAEIISTTVANGMVNRAGMTYAFRLGEETGADAAEIARGYLIAREVFSMEETWGEIEALDNRVPARVQIAMLLESRKLSERAARWLLRNRARPLDIGTNVEFFLGGVREVSGFLPGLVAATGGERHAKACEGLTSEGVPESLATRVSTFGELFSALDIVQVARTAGRALEEVAGLYFAVGSELELHWLRDCVLDLPRENRWQALARAALRDELYSQQSAITGEVLRDGADAAADAAERVRGWMERNRIAVARCRQIFDDLKAAGTPDFTMVSVAMREVRAIRRTEGEPPAKEAEPSPPEVRAVGD